MTSNNDREKVRNPLSKKAIMEKAEKHAMGSITFEDRYVVFKLDEHFFALPVSIVERIVRAVYITPVPGAPDHVLGIINIQGQPVPVFSIRKIFGLPAREIQLTDQIILARTSKHTISFVADMVTGVVNRNGRNRISAGQIFTGLEKIVEGLVFCDNGIILIYDPEKLFTLENMEKLDLTMLEKKMKEIQNTGDKASRERQEKKETVVKRTDVEKKNRKTKKNKKIKAEK